MRINHFVALLDTCVLAPMPLADTLLRLASEPAFYTPRWSPEILAELKGTLARFELTQYQIERRLKAMEEHFPDALVTGHDSLIPALTNDPKDRHVLAAAIKSGAHAIISANTKHFPEVALKPFGLECLSPAKFLTHQYHLNPDLFIATLEKQAADIRWSMQQLLARHIPALSKLIKV